jgi:1-aminocyclopropane-1-carboxylate deaminase/D-cysteine desulfhydrase-like pyridoxal-dependent ACC family enzyme
VQCVEKLASARSELWIKRDDRTSDVYGGNKVRKLERILGEAVDRGARRIVTVGAAGSHHVLATAYFGRRAGLEVEAVLVPQPYGERALAVMRAALGLGLRAFPVRSWASAPWAIARRVARGARYVPLGGSSISGSMAYVDAARELVVQVRRGELPAPDVCVVALGSGGTASGLAAGFEAEGVRTRVVGVCIAEPAWLLGGASRWLARACARQAGIALPRAALRARLSIDARFLGAGYGHPTTHGAEAIELARAAAGLELDPTYTAKAFAAALWYVGARRARRILYWHTLSSAPIQPLLEGAPPEDAVDLRLRALVLPP